MRARYPGWNDAVEGTLKKWMRETALLLAQVHDLSSHLAAHPLQIDTTKAFAELIGGHNHNGNNLQALMELAIFLDDWHDFNRAVHLYRLLNYANIDRATGESGEMCRDYAHGHGNIAHMGFIAELAWHQGVDLYSMRGNALLTMSEYHAAQLLGELRGVTCTQGEYDGMSSSFTPEEKALFDDYAGPYEVLYNHYVNRMGLSMPYTQRYLAQERPMGGTDTQNAFGATLFYPGSSRQALPDPVAVDGTAVPSRDHVTAAAAPGRSGRSAAVRYDLRGKTLGAAGTDVVGCTVETAPYGGRLLVRVDPR